MFVQARLMERFSSPDRDGSEIHTRDSGSRTVCEIYGLAGIEERAFISWKGSGGGVTLWRTRIERRPRDFFIAELFRKISIENVSLCQSLCFQFKIFLRSLFKSNTPNVSILCQHWVHVQWIINLLNTFFWRTKRRIVCTIFLSFRINEKLDKTRLMVGTYNTKRANNHPLPRLQIVQ